MNTNLGNIHGVRHAYAYGHTKKAAVDEFKTAIKDSDDKQATALSFKDAMKNTEATKCDDSETQT